jgi:hypothetical protein
MIYYERIGFKHAIYSQDISYNFYRTFLDSFRVYSGQWDEIGFVVFSMLCILGLILLLFKNPYLATLMFIWFFVPWVAFYIITTSDFSLSARIFSIKYALSSLPPILFLSAFSIYRVSLMFPRIISWVSAMIITGFLVFGNINLWYSYVKFPTSFSFPIFISDWIDRVGDKISEDDIVYADPNFTTRSHFPHLLFYYLSRAGIQPKIFVDRTLEDFLLRRGYGMIDPNFIIKEDELINMGEPVRVWWVSPILVPRYYDELNILEWWNGDYEGEMEDKMLKIEKDLRMRGFEDITFSLGIIGFSNTISVRNFGVRDRTAKWYLR